MRVLALVIIGCLMGFSGTAKKAYGDIYMYVDENGVVNFSNTPTSSKFRLFMKEKPKTAEKSETITGIGRPHTRYDGIIKVAADYHNVDPRLVKAIVRAESNFNSQAVSPKGAKGLMQLMPRTIRFLRIADPFDARENIMGGTRYFRHLLNRFDGNIETSLAAYNAGPTAVGRYKGIPPYTETKQYVKKVMAFWKGYKNTP